MYSMKKLLFILLIGLGGNFIHAQTPSDSLPAAQGLSNLTVVKQFMVQAKVISFLQGHDDLAVIQVTKAPYNPWNLKSGDEVLVTFMLKPKDSKTAASGDLIRGEMLAKMNRNTVQVDYTIMRYSVLTSPIEKSEAPSTDGSQK